MKPQIVQEIREQTVQKDEVGKVVQSIEPVVLNRVDMKMIIYKSCERRI